jgi:hypothetical protein
MAITANNTTLTFNDATTQTTSGVTSVGVSTGLSSTGGKTPTLTNTGVTSVTAGSGISVSASTGGVTISAAGGGVTSLNGQTGAITNTTIDNIGSWVGAVVNTTALIPNTGNSNAFNLVSYAQNSTLAGSSLRYGLNVTIGDTQINGSPAFATPYVREVGSRSAIGYAGGGTALSGTYRAMTGTVIISRHTNDDTSIGFWYLGLWVRIS